MELEKVICDDIRNIAEKIAEKMSHKKVLVTGGTGLLGSMICRSLINADKERNLDVEIIVLVRNKEKASSLFADLNDNGNITFLEQDITEPILYDGKVDYIIHTACPTASNTFVTKPVETISSITLGTMNVLKFAKESQSESVVYLSSMEAYGQITEEILLKPEDVGYVNPLSLRSCYPEGKRVAENLCMGYFSEYNVPVKVIRLAQTFGPGISNEDKRVFAQFLRSAKSGEDIVMFTEGGAKRMYTDTMDAVDAILTVLLKGENGQIYNVGNKATYCSIKEMAEMVIRFFGAENAKVVIDRSKDVGQYPPENKLLLDVDPIENLGWTPKYSLQEIYERMDRAMKKEK